MDKPAIKKFAIWARNKLIADTKYRAGLVGVTETAVAEPLPQSNESVQFFDVGLPQPYRIEGDAVTQRQRFVAELNKETAKQGSYTAAYQTVVDKVAYTWFNRLIAVRYMEVNDLLPSRTRVLSSADGRAEPQIVTSPFDAVLDYSPAEQQQIVNLKNNNKLDEAFRLLFLKQCAALGDCLPRLFEQVDDYMPLLLALSFTDKDGVVCHLVNDIPESDWQDAVQIVGWLYQYYNTEPKEQVFANLKKNIKISKENIPAATQLFTPDWIVRYMVENSLGRLWSEGHPDFDKSEWKYYLDEAPQEPQVAQQLAELRKGYAALTPEDIKCIDPCMGSGHILAYLFDVLMQIYRSAGYGDRDAAASIVEHNLYGLDIDDRAAQMAYFVVMMKGCHYDSRFLRRHLNPHVYAIQESRELPQTAFGYCGPEEPTARTLWDTFKNAKEYGSILQPKVTLKELDKLEARLQEADSMAGYGSLGVQGLTYQLLDVMYPLIDQARMLVQKYDVVVTNPPYMGSGGMSGMLLDYLKNEYFDVKADLFSACIKKMLKLARCNGFVSYIAPQSWMFLSTQNGLRKDLLQCTTLVNLLDLGTGVFDSGFGTAAVVFSKCNLRNMRAVCIDLTNTVDKCEFVHSNASRYNCESSTFLMLPGNIFSYSCTPKYSYWFQKKCVGDYAVLDCGIKTGNNNTFVRLWYEVSIQATANKDVNLESLKSDKYKWYKYSQGGGFHRWYGAIENVVNIGNDAADIKRLVNKSTYRLRDKEKYFLSGMVWPMVGTNNFSCRYLPQDVLPDIASNVVYCKKEYQWDLLAYMNSKVFNQFIMMINPTVNYPIDSVASVPFSKGCINNIVEIKNRAQENVKISKTDWDAFETSWDFKRHPLV